MPDALTVLCAHCIAMVLDCIEVLHTYLCFCQWLVHAWEMCPPQSSFLSKGIYNRIHKNFSVLSFIDYGQVYVLHPSFFSDAFNECKHVKPLAPNQMALSQLPTDITRAEVCLME